MVIMGKTFRVVVCGTKECGKTSIIERAIYNRSGVRIDLPYSRENNAELIQDSSGFSTLLISKNAYFRAMLIQNFH